MDGINRTTDGRDGAREAQRMQANRAELVERLMRAVPQDAVLQPLEGIFLARASAPMAPVHSVVKPSFCVIAQGSKEVLLGESRYRYDPDHYLIFTIELPRVSQILEASKTRPYLSFRMELNPALVSSVMTEAALPMTPLQADARAMDVNPMNADLQDAVLRLVRLLDAAQGTTKSEQIVMLMPLITREIIYRLLISEQGARLRHLAAMGGYTSLVARAVERLRQNLDQPLRIEDLARELGMSVSGLHHHFKAVTAMSPLQFQKHLRLQEARRLMLSEDLDAASTAYRLGYHDAAHFNREYKSLFGAPPIRDVQRMREELQVPAQE